MIAEAEGFVERRRPRRPGQSATELLAAFSGLVLLERLPVPALAVRDDGRIMFANDAFVAISGYPRQQLTSTKLGTILPRVPLGETSFVATLRGHANSVVELTHAEGWSVAMAMSASLLLRRDDPLALVTFVDLTEQMWHAGKSPCSRPVLAARFPGW